MTAMPEGDGPVSHTPVPALPFHGVDLRRVPNTMRLHLMADGLSGTMKRLGNCGYNLISSWL